MKFVDDDDDDDDELKVIDNTLKYRMHVKRYPRLRENIGNEFMGAVGANAPREIR